MVITAGIREAIQAYMADQGLSAQALASRLGLSNSTVSRWISANGAGEIRPSHWAKLKPLLATYLDPPRPPDLRSQIVEVVREVTGRVVPAEGPTRTCGLYGLALCASKGFRFGDVVPHNDDVEQVSVPAELSRVRRPSAFRAVDDSMAPTVQPGDLVYIDPDEDVRPGAVVLAKFDDTVVCKRWQPDAATRRILLYSDAPGTPPLSVAESDIQWRHRVIYVQPKGKTL